MKHLWENTFIESTKWYEKQVRTIIYIDESGFAQYAPSRCGYAAVGQRCPGLHNWHERGRTNVIGVVFNSSLVAACLFVGTINAGFFEWLSRDLLPRLLGYAV